MGSIDEAGCLQFLAFAIAGTDYGIPVLRLREIIQCDAITPVPSVPRWVRGVLNLRGSVIPVLDLAVKFGQRDTPVDGQSCVLVVEVDLAGERILAGVMADSVNEVVDLGSDEIMPPPPFGSHVKPEYLLGLAPVGDRFAFVLDLDRVTPTP
jgi:purine-binding chemotaxis protein CheW